MIRRGAVLFAALAGGLGCRTPTQITVEVRTDIVCESDHPETSITVGTIGESLETKSPVTVVTSSQCLNHRIGALVVVPSGSKDAPLAIRIVTGIGKSAERCVTDAYVGGCIVARRALHFIPHESLDLPITMSVSCRDVPCDSTKTCVGGACVSATIGDPGTCHGDGCNLLPPDGSDGGIDAVADSTIDASPDVSPTDATLDGRTDAIDSSVVDSDAGGSLEWAKALGDRSITPQSDIAIDADGNVYVASSFRGTIDVGGAKTAPAGNHDALLTKISRGGVISWSKQLGAVEDDYGLAVATDAAGNVVLAGVTNGDIDFGGGLVEDTGSADLYLAKYDPTGKYLTAKRFHGGTANAALGVAIDSGGNITLAGGVASNANFGGATLTVTTNDVFLARFDASLSHLGSTTYGGSKDDFLYGFSGTKDGGVVLVGTSNGTIDFGAGAHTSSAGDYDVFVTRIDSSMTAKWSRYYGDPTTQIGQSVTVDELDRAVVGGFMDGTVDFGRGAHTGPGLFVLRFDASGTIDFDRVVASTYADRIRTIATDESNRITLGGYFEGTLAFGTPALTVTTPGTDRGDLFLVQLDVTGAFVRSRSYGEATQRQEAIRVIIDRPSGALVTMGGFGASLAFPFGTLTTTKPYETFIARLLP